jgi:hypothetical protein
LRSPRTARYRALRNGCRAVRLGARRLPCRSVPKATPSSARLGSALQRGDLCETLEDPVEVAPLDQAFDGTEFECGTVVAGSSNPVSTTVRGHRRPSSRSRTCRPDSSSRPRSSGSRSESCSSTRRSVSSPSPASPRRCTGRPDRPGSATAGQRRLVVGDKQTSAPSGGRTPLARPRGPAVAGVHRGCLRPRARRLIDSLPGVQIAGRELLNGSQARQHGRSSGPVTSDIPEPTRTTDVRVTPPPRFPRWRPATPPSRRDQPCSRPTGTCEVPHIRRWWMRPRSIESAVCSGQEWPLGRVRRDRRRRCVSRVPAVRAATRSSVGRVRRAGRVCEDPHGWVEEIGEIAVAGDEYVGLGVEGGGDQVVVVGVTADRGCMFGVVHEVGASRRPQYFWRTSTLSRPRAATSRPVACAPCAYVRGASQYGACAGAG